MAATDHLLSLLLFLLPFFLLGFAAGIADQELDALVLALRSKGYHLFPNALQKFDDLRLHILAGAAVTIFAPTDSALFALEITDDASEYTLALLRHVVPTLLPYPSLRALPAGSYLPTLLSDRDVRICRPLGGDRYFLTVDGIDIVLPGIFHGAGVAVHGLNGIMGAEASPDCGGETLAPVAGLSPGPSPVHQDSAWSPVSGVSPASIVAAEADKESRAGEGRGKPADLRYQKGTETAAVCNANGADVVSHSGTGGAPRPHLAIIFD